MRKWLASLGYLLAILAAIFLLLPLFMGLLAEKKCAQITEVINTTTPFDIKITNYQRGWFSSDATAQILSDKFDISGKSIFQLTINAHITHGPVLVDWARCQFTQAMIIAQINLNPLQNLLLKRSNDAGPIATTKINFNLNGSADINLDSPPFAYKDQETSLIWQGLKIETTLSSLCNKIKSKIEFAGIETTFKDYSFQLGKTTSLYQGNKNSNNLWIGERHLQSESFTIKNENNHTTAFSGLKLHNLTTDNNQDTINIITDVIIDNLSLNGGTYTQNNLAFEINGLNQASLLKLKNQFTANKTIPSLTDIGFNSVSTLLNSGNEINIKQLTTNTPWGKLLATIKILFAKQQKDSGFLATITNTTLNTDIKTERALALHLLEKFYKIMPSKQPTDPTKLAADLITTWEQSGRITTSDPDNYLHIAIDYKNGQLLINDKQLILTTKP